MRISGTDIYIPHGDSGVLSLKGNFNGELIMRFSFLDITNENYIILASSNSFKIDWRATGKEPSTYFYEIIEFHQGLKKTLVKKSLFVIEETARSAAGMTYDDILAAITNFENK